MTTASPEMTKDGDGHGDHAEHAHPKFVAHHFDNPAHQFDAAKLGMWVFIATEILMFGGLFVAYVLFRNAEPQVFHEAYQRLNRVMGAINTVVLIFSSLTAALAVRSAQLGKRNQTSIYLVVTILCACIFLLVKFFEYRHKFVDGLLPGHHFLAHLPAYAHNGHTLPYRAQVFFALYFMMTGLHGVHVVIGMSLLGWVLRRNIRGDFSKEYFTPVEIGALYWHLVDLVWIYLFPLLYLVG